MPKGRATVHFTIQSNHKVLILILFPLYSLPEAKREKKSGLDTSFGKQTFSGIHNGSMAAGPWASSNKKSHTEEVYNSVKVLSWHLSSLIFDNAVRPTNMMDCILGTMIVFSGGERPPQTN